MVEKLLKKNKSFLMEEKSRDISGLNSNQKLRGSSAQSATHPLYSASVSALQSKDKIKCSFVSKFLDLELSG